MSMRRFGFFASFSFLAGVVCAQAKPLQVIASTTDLAAIARDIGGEYVNVSSLCRADQDPHHFEILPQHVLAVRRANVYLKVGAGLDFWTEELLPAAENLSLHVTDCSRGVNLIHEAEAEHDHAHHAHELGNPHYWLGPSNANVIAVNIASGLQQADPEHVEEYRLRLSQFIQRFDSAFTSWQNSLAACRGTAIVTYHRTWDYFTRDFGLDIIGTIEPQPGVEPSPMGLAQLERQIKQHNSSILLLEPFASERLANLLARDTGITVLHASPSVGDKSGDIITHFDHLVRELRAHCTASPRDHE